MKNIFNTGVTLLKTLTVLGQFTQSVNFKDSKDFIDSIRHRLHHRGKLDTILWLKNLRVIVYAYLSGEVVNPGFISTTKDGLPKAFGPQIPYLRSREPYKIRFVLTILLQSRTIEAWKVPSLDSIVNPSTRTFDINQMKPHIGKILKSMGLKPQDSPTWSTYHFTAKSGPNGPAMKMADAELSLISNHYPDQLNNQKEQGGDEFSDTIEKITIENDYPDGCLRKLSLVKDVDGKHRVIAIGDYWSQSVLKPYHDFFLKSLERLGESDQTFGQSIGPFGDSSQLYHSYDLSSATDRLPIEQNILILEFLFGSEIASRWRDVMVGIPFKNSFSSQSPVSYSVGQPMGLYSSWAMLAISHHVVVRYAALLVGKTNFTDYRLLGDDIVIRDNQVSESYRKLMLSLGVEISKEKTQISKDTFEFAKRLFLNEVEVTGFPLNSILRFGVKSNDIVSTIVTSLNRGFTYCDIDLPLFIRKVSDVVLNINRKDRISPSSIDILSILASVSVQHDNPEFIKTLASKLGILKCRGNLDTLVKELLALQLEETYENASKTLADSISKLESVQDSYEEMSEEEDRYLVYPDEEYPPLETIISDSVDRLSEKIGVHSVIDPRGEIENLRPSESMRVVFREIKDLDLLGLNPFLAKVTRKYDRAQLILKVSAKKALKTYLTNLEENKRTGGNQFPPLPQ